MKGGQLSIQPTKPDLLELSRTRTSRRNAIKHDYMLPESGSHPLGKYLSNNGIGENWTHVPV